MKISNIDASATATNKNEVVMNIFSTNVSVYDGVTDNKGRVMCLRDFLFSHEHQYEIQMLRHLENKEERDGWKRKLPQATIGGVFQPTRAIPNLQTSSGLICIDIDAKENPEISDWDDLKNKLAVIPQIAYCSLSVSANGLFAIIPLCYPDKHLLHFRQLQSDFWRMGIIIDAACSDITRMRCISYDTCPLINEQAIPYEGIYVEPPRRKNTIRVWDNAENDIISEVAECCRQIQWYSIDITRGYDQWLKVGCSLASIGEDGRQFFHVCSQQNLNYNESKTDKMFTDLLKRNYQNINIGTFFWICKQNNIQIKHNYKEK